MLDHPIQPVDAGKPRSWNQGKLIGAKLGDVPVDVEKLR